MTINGIEEIKDDGGDYLVLADAGWDGLRVAGQCNTLDEALMVMDSDDLYGPTCLVRLVRLDWTGRAETP